MVKPDDLLLYSLEVAGADGYWVEFSRPLIQAHVSLRTAAMRDVYPEALEAARLRMREGEPISNVHRAAYEPAYKKLTCPARDCRCILPAQ